MKRISALLLILCLLALPALAEPEPAKLALDEPLAIDLDGDGTEETVSWTLEMGEYEECVHLRILSANGEEVVWSTPILWGEAVYVVDLDGDGRQEILASGDVMSDDYITYCLRWDGAGLYELLFPDCSRAQNTDGYYKEGYGQITAIDGNRVTLSGSQDMLGTWFAERTVTLSAHDRFEFADDGLWVRNLSGRDDDSLWGYAALTAAVPLEYADAEGNPAGTLQPGDKLLVCATDKETFVRFLTPDGTEGTLAISRNYEQGWGWLVDGTPEEDCFEHIPYAD